MSQFTPEPGFDPARPEGSGTEAYKRYEPIKPEDPLKALLRRIWAPIAILGGLALKFKSAPLVVLKLKVFATSGTMLVSVAAYAWIWGWRFGVGLVVMLLIHELGHVFELRRQGIKASAPIFIPFLGAVVGMKEMPKNAWREAQVALAGPILGSLGAAGAWILGEVFNSDALIAIAFVGFLLNLFNLLPIVPLDGGRAAAALHPALWGVGLLGLVALTVWRPNPILLLILLFGALELWRRWKDRGNPDARGYYKITAAQRATVGVTYVGLALLLGFAMSATHIERSF